MKDYYLYLDTSDHLILGLLNSSFEWLEYTEILGGKNSGKIHLAINEILSKHNINPFDLLGIIQNAGPGSYTGMRVSEGLSQLFEWKGMSIVSFYHFEVPGLLGVQKGTWIAKAFKGEFFIYSWDQNEEKKELVSLEALRGKLPQDFLYTHFKTSVQKEFSEEELKAYQETGDLIKNQAKNLFASVLKRNKRFGPYYFRSVDQEFKTSL